MSRIPSNSDKANQLRANKNFNVGDKVNLLTLTRRYKDGNQWKWDCDCDCGGQVSVPEYRLKNEILGIDDNTGSCGCLQEATNLGSKANRKGTIESKYSKITKGGCKVLCETPYRDSNRSKVYIAECPFCGKAFLTVGRTSGKSCGCQNGKPPNKIEDYILNHNYKSVEEKKIGTLLKKNNIFFECHKTYDDLVDKAQLPFDFFVDNKYVIEYDGEQHFNPISFFDYDYTHKHDLMKNNYCFKHSIPLIRIPANVKYTIDDLILETTRFLLTPENEKEYYESRKK